LENGARFCESFVRIGHDDLRYGDTWKSFWSDYRDRLSIDKFFGMLTVVDESYASLNGLGKW
jgi:hypothetical protein